MHTLQKGTVLRVQGAEGGSSGVLKWSSSHTQSTLPSSSALLFAGHEKHSCCRDDILYVPGGQAEERTHSEKIYYTLKIRNL